MKNLLRIVIAASLSVSVTCCVFAQTHVPLYKTVPALIDMPTPDDSGLAPVNDIRLYYAVYNKQGRNPVILLHGGFGSSDFWCREVPLLEKKHKVIVIDSRGHGRSTMSAQPMTYDLLASDIEQVMNYLHIPKASIVGWSDGGIIGLIMAMRWPQSVNKLFTFGTNYSRSGEKSDPPDSAMRAQFMKLVITNYQKHSPAPDSFPALRKALFTLYGKEPELDTNQLKKITAPTVIGAGEYDQFYTREHFRQLARYIPHAVLVVMPGVGHGGPLQDPVGFHRAVSRLLDAP